MYKSILENVYQAGMLQSEELRDRCKGTRLLVCDVFDRVLSRDFVDYSADGDRQARIVSLLVKRTMRAWVDLVHIGAGWVFDHG